MQEAKIILDSKNSYKNRLTTFKLKFPKFILAELNTHRVLSKSTSSSRAIPTKKYMEEAFSDELRVTPVVFKKNIPGMQGGEELRGQELENAKEAWRNAARSAVNSAQSLLDNGVAKEIVNRCIENFVHANTVLTGTEFANFFALRMDKDAQPEIRALAIKMFEEYKSSIPFYLTEYNWHLPFVTEDDRMLAADIVFGKHKPIHLWDQRYIDILIKISVARCARTSYVSHTTGKQSTIEEDIELYSRLLDRSPIHATPAEHIAKPDTKNIFGVWKNKKLHGNFIGFQQFRKTLPNEYISNMEDLDVTF